MKIGTKSVLFGVHQFLLHPILVALAWWKLYGFPNKIQYWIAFFVHDLGYIGKPNMDGQEGEEHVMLGGEIMANLFGPRWGEFTLYHSRFQAPTNGSGEKMMSRLCVADKFSFCITPDWLYLLQANLSGEIHEYMEKSRIGKYVSMNLSTITQHQWRKNLKEWMQKFVDQNRSSAIYWEDK